MRTPLTTFGTSEMMTNAEESTMSIGDKAKDAVQQVAGKAEEAVGKRTDDAELTAQGQKDQGMGEARMDVEKAKDAVKD